MQNTLPGLRDSTNAQEVMVKTAVSLVVTLIVCHMFFYRSRVQEQAVNNSGG